MKTSYTNNKTWRTSLFAVCTAFALLCCTTVFAQTPYGPFASTGAVDLSAVDGAYDGTIGSMGSSAVAVSGVVGTSVVDIRVDVAITHTWEGDLTLKLQSPDGSILTLASRPGLAETLDDGNDCCGNNSGWSGAAVTFSDDGTTDGEELGLFGEGNAGEDICSGDFLCSYFPSPGATLESATAFGDFFGETMDGTWTLYAGDAASGDLGSIDSWSITITTASPSFTLVKTVNLEPDPSGLDCFDIPVGTEQSIGVNPGDSVCYWYTVTNTGDVDFDLVDFMDDQLIPGGLVGVPGFDLLVGSSLAIPWSGQPIEINAEVTNIADLTYYNPVSGLTAATQTDQATVGIIPPNDECANAVPLTCGVPVVGTTEFSTDAGNATGCAQFIDDLAVWYSFVGTGNPVQLTTCGATTDGSSAAYIAVFEGTCGALVCEPGGALNLGADPDCGLANSQLVEMETVAGTTYYVTVTEAAGFPGVIDFDLTLNCLPPANDDVCAAAPLSFGSNGPFYNETATAEVGEPLPPATGCGVQDGWCDFENGLDNTTWYSFVAPASGNVTVSTDFSDHDTQLAVYEAASCADVLAGGATLVAANDDNSAYIGTLFSSLVDLPCLTPGVTYYVQVDGYNGDFGPVMVELTDNGGVAVSGNVSGGGLSCDGADVDIFADFTGTGPWTIEVAADGVSIGVFTDVPTPALFTSTDAATYTFLSVTDQTTGCTTVGTGGAVVTVGASPVAAFTSVETGLDAAFTDVSTETPTSWMWDFGDGNTSSLQNPTHTYGAGGTYTVCLIAINDCDTDGDTSCVAVTVAPPAPANDLCVDAEAILCGGTATGSTATATATDASDCQPTGLGVWYLFVGTGDDVTISTDNAGTDFDTYLGVTESCGGACFASDDDGGFGTTSMIEFSSVLGQDYYIQVSSYNGTITGNFELSVTCVAPPLPPANDDVCNAAPLVLGANTGFTNVGATVEVGEPLPLPTGCGVQDGWCDFESGLDNTTWFTFQGPASGNLVIDTDGSDDDTQIAAYSAVSCQDFSTASAVQLAANDDNPDWITTIFSSIVFLCDLTPGETYYLQVDGYGGAEGAIVVNLTETTVDAGFTYAPTGLSVDFTDASATSTTIASYSWDFGDASPVSTDMNPTYVYGAAGPYTVCLTVTDENGCTSEYCEAIQVTDPVTIAEAVESGLEVYPNPSNGQFVLEVRGVEADVQIVVMDVAGRQVYNEGATLNNSFRKELNLNVAKGTYLLQIATVEGLVTRKIQIH